MAKAHCCDQCGKLIKDSDILITIDGFSVLQNRENNDMPKGFAIGKPEDFCSFSCMSEWTMEQQKLLDEYIQISEKHYGEALKDGSTTDLTPPNEPLTPDSRLTPKMVSCPKGWQGVRDTRFYCPGCKKAVKKGEKYCHKCGQAILFPVERYDKDTNTIWLDFSDHRTPEEDR